MNQVSENPLLNNQEFNSQSKNLLPQAAAHLNLSAKTSSFPNQLNLLRKRLSKRSSAAVEVRRILKKSMRRSLNNRVCRIV